MADAPLAPQRMHTYDERLTRLVLDYVQDRLSMPETPLDHPGEKAEVDAILDGLVTAGGRDAAEVLALYDEHLSKTVLSADSPRYWAFIPAAPTKAALLSERDGAARDEFVIRLPIFSVAGIGCRIAWCGRNPASARAGRCTARKCGMSNACSGARRCLTGRAWIPDSAVGATDRISA